MENYIELKTLGKGGNGCVVKVKSLDSNELFAMKKLFFNANDEEECKKMSVETEILKKLNHQNIVSYKESFIDKDTLCIIMEYLDNGDLESIIKKHAKELKHLKYSESDTKELKSDLYISEDKIWDWFFQLCDAINYIHDKNIIHRDIKAQNILMNSSGELKLGDFGISKILSEELDFASTTVGTPFFLSPEICAGEKYNSKTDIWMLGCLLYELCSLKKPFNGDSLHILMKNIMQMDPEPIPEHFSDSMKALVNKLLNKNPNSRPSIKEILKYDFVVKKLKYRKNKIMIRPPSIAPIRKVSADKKTEKEMFNQDSFKADEYRKTKLKINIEEDEENNQIAHSGNIPNLENDNKSPFNKIMSGGGPHHRQTQSYNIVGKNLNTFNKNFLSPYKGNFQPQVSPHNFSQHRINNDSGISIDYSNYQNNNKAINILQVPDESRHHIPPSNKSKNNPKIPKGNGKISSPKLDIPKSEVSKAISPTKQVLQQYINISGITNEDKVFVMKYRDMSSNHERNKHNIMITKDNSSFDRDRSSIADTKGNSNMNLSQVTNLTRDSSKPKYTKNNNTSKHANMNRIKIDFSIEQSDDPTSSGQLKLENYEEIKTRPSSKTLSTNVREKSIDKEQREKSQSYKGHIRKYSDSNVMNSLNKKLLEQIKHLSQSRYGESITDKLLLLINQLGNIREVLSKDSLLKDIFHEDYLEAKEYFSPVLIKY